SLIDSSRYFLVCQDSKTLELPGLKHIDRWKDYAHMLIELDDETLLKQCSTTPILEPPYFPQMMREMAAYLLEQNETVLPLKAPLLKDHPVFAMQGEIVSMVKKP
ncbi:MAG TPA: hypothetical protein VLF61_03175, partial [Rhabdochlamydiaceae bacterium]|nr:hypothetical protein [Rhabdochlamydiaceae bacterium]